MTVVERVSCVDQVVVPVTVRLRPAVDVAVTGRPTGRIGDVGHRCRRAGHVGQPAGATGRHRLPPARFRPARPSHSDDRYATTGFASAPGGRAGARRVPDGGVQVTWSWPAVFELTPGQSGSIELTGHVDAQATPGSFANTSTLTADNLSQPQVRTVDMAIGSPSLLTGRKLVRGSRDVSFAGAGTKAHTRPAVPPPT